MSPSHEHAQTATMPLAIHRRIYIWASKSRVAANSQSSFHTSNKNSQTYSHCSSGFRVNIYMYKIYVKYSLILCYAVSVYTFVRMVHCWAIFSRDVAPHWPTSWRTSDPKRVQLLMPIYICFSVTTQLRSFSRAHESVTIQRTLALITPETRATHQHHHTSTITPHSYIQNHLTCALPSTLHAGRMECASHVRSSLMWLCLV